MTIELDSNSTDRRYSEDVIVFEGDSLTFQGTMQARMQNIFSYSQTHNVATGGNTIQNITSQAATEVDSLYNAAGSNRLFLWIGANNLLDTGTETAQEVLDQVWAYVDARKALGWEVTISTLPQSDGLADAAKFLEYNDLIRAQWKLHANEMIDIAADPRFQDHTDTTYFQADELHLSYSGNEAVADILDELYMPTAGNKVTYIYFDLGNVSYFEHGGAPVIHTMGGGAYGDGTPIDGAIWYELDGTSHRVTYNDLGTAHTADMNGDGNMDILSIEGTYSTGTPVEGAVWYEMDASMHRITYNELGDYRLSDIDGDGEIEIISNMGSYSSGGSLGGAVYYDLDGTMNRLTYFDLGDYSIADWDNDGAMEIISNMGQYSNGTSLSGMVVVEADGTFTRLNYYDAGANYEIVDMDGDGNLEVFSSAGKYQNGGDIGGAVTFDQTGAMHRYTYNTLGTYKIVDVEGDGDMEVVSTGDYYNPTTAVGGTVMYDTDGLMHRLNYYEMTEFTMFDFDNDGEQEIISGSATYSSGVDIGGLILVDVIGQSDPFKRLAYGDFDDYEIQDFNQDGLADIINQTPNTIDAHYFLQSELV